MRRYPLTIPQSSENRFASLFEDEEEEVKTVKKEVRSNKSGRSTDKRWASSVIALIGVVSVTSVPESVSSIVTAARVAGRRRSSAVTY